MEEIRHSEAIDVLKRHLGSLISRKMVVEIEMKHCLTPYVITKLADKNDELDSIIKGVAESILYLGGRP